MQQIALFDYAALDAETRIVVQQRTSEIKTLMRSALGSMIEAGRKCSEVRDLLRHNKAGGFDGWIEAEELGRRTTYSVIGLYEAFGNCANFAQLDIAKTAAYLLAAPSTPEPARIEAIERAQAGEPITHGAAKAIIEEYKAPSVAPIHTNGNGYHTPVDEYEQQSSAWEESHNGYTWTAPEPSIVDVAEQVGYRLAAANHTISDDPNYDGDEWYTPQEYIDAAAEVMGCIDVDPASCDAAQKFVNAATYYTKQDNGLEYPWIGNAWINPPYSMPLIQQFVEKLIAEYENGNISQAVIITNNSSDTRWFHTLLSRFPACFTRGRVQFWRPNHDTFGTRQGQALFYVGPNVLKFEAVFSRFGIVVTKL